MSQNQPEGQGAAPDRSQPGPSDAPATPLHSLQAALGALSFEVEPGRFALLGFPEEPHPDDLEAVLAAPGQLVREGGETTLLVREEQLEGLLGRHPGAQVERDLCWIRFRMAMGWDVVGFLARVTSELAAAGVPLGAVCGYSRDHLFVAADQLVATREVLARLGTERSIG